MNERSHFSGKTLKDVQATGEAFSPQKRAFSTSKNEIFIDFLLFLWIIFALLYPDPDCEKSGS